MQAGNAAKGRIMFLQI